MSPTALEAAENYARLQVQTATLAKKICMLHVRCVELVMMADEEPTGPSRRILLDKAQNILSQLLAALRVEDAVGKSLFYLYNHCYVLLQRGDATDLHHVLEIVVILRNTLDDLLKTT